MSTASCVIGARVGVKTTVIRMPAAPLQEPGARNDYACHIHAQTRIDGFIASLSPPPLR
ncbi:MAG: acetyl esterase [Janthinobacterium sp.]|jgi:acetyl esterase